MVACKKCLVPKPEEAFTLQKSHNGKEYRHGTCTECIRARAAANRRARYATPEGKKEILASNQKYFTKPGIAEERAKIFRDYYNNDPVAKAAIQTRSRGWRYLNPEKKRVQAAKYYQENKSHIQAKVRADLAASPWKKLRNSIKLRVTEVLQEHNTTKGGQSFLKFLPYGIEELRDHLELQFEDWMNWSNYGEVSEAKPRAWNLDHIVPQVMFPYDSMDTENFRLCWSLTNLRPLDSKRNFSEGNKRSLLSEFPLFIDIVEAMPISVDDIDELLHIVVRLIRRNIRITIDAVMTELEL